LTSPDMAERSPIRGRPEGVALNFNLNYEASAEISEEVDVVGSDAPGLSPLPRSCTLARPHPGLGGKWPVVGGRHIRRHDNYGCTGGSRESFD
jgi:hypothetical protein